MENKKKLIIVAGILIVLCAGILFVLHLRNNNIKNGLGRGNSVGIGNDSDSNGGTTDQGPGGSSGIGNDIYIPGTVKPIFNPSQPFASNAPRSPGIVVQRPAGSGSSSNTGDSTSSNGGSGSGGSGGNGGSTDNGSGSGNGPSGGDSGNNNGGTGTEGGSGGNGGGDNGGSTDNGGANSGDTGDTGSGSFPTPVGTISNCADNATTGQYFQTVDPSGINTFRANACNYNLPIDQFTSTYVPDLITVLSTDLGSTSLAIDDSGSQGNWPYNYTEVPEIPNFDKRSLKISDDIGLAKMRTYIQLLSDATKTVDLVHNQQLIRDSFLTGTEQGIQNQLGQVRNTLAAVEALEVPQDLVGLSESYIALYANYMKSLHTKLELRVKDVASDPNHSAPVIEQYQNDSEMVNDSLETATTNINLTRQLLSDKIQNPIEQYPRIARTNVDPATLAFLNSSVSNNLTNIKYNWQKTTSFSVVSRDYSLCLPKPIAPSENPALRTTVYHEIDLGNPFAADTDPFTYYGIAMIDKLLYENVFCGPGNVALVGYGEGAGRVDTTGKVVGIPALYYNPSSEDDPDNNLYACNIGGTSLGNDNRSRARNRSLITGVDSRYGLDGEISQNHVYYKFCESERNVKN